MKISEKEKEILEKISDKDEPKLSPEQKTILEIINKRKTVEMIRREYNLALKPLDKELMTKEKILENLKALRQQRLVKSVTGADGKEYWVDIKFFREKLLGTEKL